MDEREVRFRDEDTVLAGVPGEVIEVVSANPVNFHQAITEPAGGDAITIDGKLFVPPGRNRSDPDRNRSDPGRNRSDPDRNGSPLVMLVPGSLGVGPNHLAHAETLVRAGIAAFVLDPFGERSVSSTVGNQTQYSFAASAFDVLAALRLLAGHPAIDARLISAQGHSRGGSAVLTASMRRFADPIVGPDLALAGTYAVYPWAGYQFVDPDIGATRLRAIVGELDDWVSLQQVQAQTHAVTLRGGEASCRIVAGAAHSFDRHEPVHELPDARVAPAAPTVQLADDGAMIDPRTGEPDPTLTDYDLFIAAVISGFGREGAHIGGVDDQPELFSRDMMAFHSSVLGE